MSKKQNAETEEKVEKQNEDINVEEEKNEQEENVEDKVEEQEDYVAKLESELIEQRKKTDEYFEHLKRNMAEFDNYKKRIAKEKDAMYNMIASDLAADILPSLDNLEKAIASETENTSFKDGISMIYNGLRDALNKMGVTEIDAQGKTFDPNLHEAVMHVEDENFGEKQVVEVFRKGYIIKDRVVRHAMVKVAN